MAFTFASGATMIDGIVTPPAPIDPVPPPTPGEDPVPASVPVPEPPAETPSEPPPVAETEPPPPPPPPSETEEEPDEEPPAQTRRERRAYETRLIRENERLKAQLAREQARADHALTLQREGPQPSQPPSSVPPTPSAPLARPARPRQEQYATWEEYATAEDTWMDGRIQEAAQHAVMQDRQQQSQAAFQQRWQAREMAGRAKYDDYDLAVQSLTVAPLLAPLVSDAFLASDHGPDLLYYLSTHPADLHALNQCSPYQAARTLAALETTLAAPPKEVTHAPVVPVPPTPQAPASPPVLVAPERPPPSTPPPPVTPAGSGAPPTGAMPERWGNLAEFEAWSARQHQLRR